MIFCTKVVQKVAKQMPVNLVQYDVKYQGKYVLCLDMHFWPHHCRKLYLGGDSCRTPVGKNLQLKLAPGSKLVQKWVSKFRNLGTVDKSKSPGKSDHQTTTIEQVAASVQQSPERSIWRRAYRASVERLCEGS